MATILASLLFLLSSQIGLAEKAKSVLITESYSGVR